MKSTNTLPLIGRIDSVNAAEWERKLTQQLDLEKETIFDAEALEYISSAGLRVLLKMQKSLPQKSRIVNVSPDVYEILEVTGFSELFDVTKRMRKVSVDGCEASRSTTPEPALIKSRWKRNLQEKPSKTAFPRRYLLIPWKSATDTA